MRDDSIIGDTRKGKKGKGGASALPFCSSSNRSSFCSLFWAIDYCEQILEHLVRVHEAGLFGPVRKGALWMEIGPCSIFGFCFMIQVLVVWL